MDAELVARLPVPPGGSDLCFVWPGEIKEAAEHHLRAYGVEVEIGPVARYGAKGEGTIDTLETTTTGFTDGIGLAIAVGHCWRKMAGTVAGFSPVAEENVVLAGVREIEPRRRNVSRPLRSPSSAPTASIRRDLAPSRRRSTG